MNSRFEKLRKKLDKAVEVYGVNSKETKKISKKFDELVSEFYKKEKQYTDKTWCQKEQRANCFFMFLIILLSPYFLRERHNCHLLSLFLPV